MVLLLQLLSWESSDLAGLLLIIQLPAETSELVGLFKCKRELLKDMSTFFTSCSANGVVADDDDDDDDPSSPLITSLSCFAKSRPLTSSSIAFIRPVARFAMFWNFQDRFSLADTQYNVALWMSQIFVTSITTETLRWGYLYFETKKVKIK